MQLQTKSIKFVNDQKSGLNIDTGYVTFGFGEDKGYGPKTARGREIASIGDEDQLETLFSHLKHFFQYFEICFATFHIQCIHRHGQTRERKRERRAVHSII